MKSWIIALFTVVSAQAMAADFGLEVGIRQQSGDADAGATTSSQMGYQAGLVSSFPISDSLGLRVGYLYTQRPLSFTNDVTSDEGKANLTYFDVPVALHFRFEDYAGAFIGAGVAINLEKGCSGDGFYSPCKLTEVKSMVIPIQLGATFKFAPQLGATVYFETIPGEVAKGLKEYRAIGANLLITFE